VGDSGAVAGTHLTLPSLRDGPLPLRPSGRRGNLRYALTLARRELRGGVRGFRVFLACLVLGVGAIAAIGSLRAAVEAGIRADAHALLGGDVSARLALSPATAAERRFLAASGRLSEVAELRAMARSLDGGRTSLIELQAVDAAYPLYGRVALAPQEPLAAALRPTGGVFGAVAEAALADRLGLRVGDQFRIGEAMLRLVATIERQPDAALGGLAFGPRVIVSPAALSQTRLIQPGALVDYVYRLRLPPGGPRAGGDADAWIARARAAFPEAGWQLRSSAEAAPS
jgi:putative ABC transport system permease protein